MRSIIQKKEGKARQAGAMDAGSRHLRLRSRSIVSMQSIIIIKNRKGKASWGNGRVREALVLASA